MLLLFERSSRSRSLGCCRRTTADRRDAVPTEEGQRQGPGARPADASPQVAAGATAGQANTRAVGGRAFSTSDCREGTSRTSVASSGSRSSSVSRQSQEDCRKHGRGAQCAEEAALDEECDRLCRPGLHESKALRRWLTSPDVGAQPLVAGLRRCESRHRREPAGATRPARAGHTLPRLPLQAAGRILLGLGPRWCSRRRTSSRPQRAALLAQRPNASTQQERQARRGTHPPTLSRQPRPARTRPATHFHKRSFGARSPFQARAGALALWAGAGLEQKQILV